MNTFITLGILPDFKEQMKYELSTNYLKVNYNHKNRIGPDIFIEVTPWRSKLLGQATMTMSIIILMHPTTLLDLG